MLKKINISATVKVVILLVVAIGCVAFAEKKSSDKVCERIVVKIKNQGTHFFLTEERILDLSKTDSGEEIVGGKLINIDLSDVERRVKSDKFVKEVRAVKNHRGDLVLDVVQRRPVARVLSETGSFYLGEEGVILPVSHRYTARVLLISGDGVQNFFRDDSAGAVLKEQLQTVVLEIDGNKFLSKAIGQIDIDADNELVLYPQISDQRFEFGSCAQPVEKLKRVELFFREIMPRKGWNSYDRVNVKFKDQIICS